MTVPSPSDLYSLATVALPSVIAGVFLWLTWRRKNQADFSVAITTGFGKLTDELQEDNKSLRAELREVRAELVAVRGQMEVMSQELRTLRWGVKAE